MFVFVGVFCGIIKTQRCKQKNEMSIKWKKKKKRLKTTILYVLNIIIWTAKKTNLNRWKERQRKTKRKDVGQPGGLDEH